MLFVVYMFVLWLLVSFVFAELVWFWFSYFDFNFGRGSVVGWVGVLFFLFVGLKLVFMCFACG